MARKQAEAEQEKREDAKSYYYPPDDDEPQEIREMEERFQKIREQKEKIFGEPLFANNESARGFESMNRCEGEEWDMMVEAVPVDIAHRFAEGEMEELFQSIVEDPPELPVEEEYSEEIEGTGEEAGE